MTSRTPPIRRFLALALAVFALAAGIGVAIAMLDHHSKPKLAVLNHQGHARRSGTATRRSGSSPTASSPTTTTGSHARHTSPSSRPTGSAGAFAQAAADARSSFDTLSGGLPGRIGAAVAPLGAGPITTYGDLQSGHAWSTMKVPVLVTLLSADERSGRTLSPTGQADAAHALEESDNAAAEALFGELQRQDGGLGGASAAVQHTLATAGDTQTTINTAPNDQGFTTWGQSIWSNTGEITFYRSLAGGCLLGPGNTRYVLGLMRSVTSSQRWGAGAAGYPASLPLAFKAGWGPEATGGYLVRQSAIVGSGDHGYVISMLALSTNGTFSGGTELIDAIAKWARAHLPVSTGAATGCPGA